MVLGQMPQYGIMITTWIDDLVDDFLGIGAQTIHNSDRTERQAVDVVGLDER